MISEALKRIYSSAPEGVRYVETISLWHPNFKQEYWLTNDINDGINPWRFLVEDNTPRTFEYIPFELTMPDSGAQGRQDLEIAIGNIGRELMDELEAAVKNPEHPIRCTYRVYLNSNMKRPENEPPMELSITDIDVELLTVTAVATRADVLNKPFPTEVYRLDMFPGLNR
jgi:hypothetical protein